MTVEQQEFLDDLVRSSTPRLTRFLLGRHYKVDQIEEIIQETYLYACIEIETVTNCRNPRTWLFSVAIHRGNRLGHKLGKERERYNEIPDNKTVDLQSLRSGSIDELLPSNTPARDRMILKMYYEQNMSTEEIAEALNVTPANARKLLSRARARLKKSLEADQ